MMLNLSRYSCRKSTQFLEEKFVFGTRRFTYSSVGGSQTPQSAMRIVCISKLLVAIISMISYPRVTSPKQTYFPSIFRVLFKAIKNCDLRTTFKTLHMTTKIEINLLVLGPLLAIETIPGLLCSRYGFSSLKLPQRSPNLVPW